jgi:chaperonin GroES
MRIFGAHVLIKPDPPEDTTRGGIILADTAKKESMIGTVVEVGQGMLFERPVAARDEHGDIVIHLETHAQRLTEVQPGDRVIFPLWAGMEMDYEGEKALFMPEDHLLAIVND